MECIEILIYFIFTSFFILIFLEIKKLNKKTNIKDNEKFVIFNGKKIKSEGLKEKIYELLENEFQKQSKNLKDNEIVNMEFLNNDNGN